MKKVAIQGIAGSYHEIVARRYFDEEEVEIIDCKTFRDVFQTLGKDDAEIGIVAIENTIAGSLLQNYELLRESNMKIFGEYKLRISHTFSALPGQSLQDIKEVISHPIAIMQCRNFLETLPHVKVIEGEDTAASARDISVNKILNQAAICSAGAAEVYGLEVLERGIETNKHNFTRFLFIADQWVADDLIKKADINKASLVFSVPHNEGSLSQVLSVLSFYSMNLTKIQSLPIIGREWEYMFYADLTFTDYTRYKQSVDAIMPLIRDFKILGEYAEGKQSLS
ncbi:MAG: prephenate dehydratase [Candidatus Azobacteroides sp.]|nr:prephenate dehydratase [Candidatus Azobacteroides sp.]